MLDTLGLADLDELPSDPIEVARVGWEELPCRFGESFLIVRRVSTPNPPFFCFRRREISRTVFGSLI